MRLYKYNNPNFWNDGQKGKFFLAEYTKTDANLTMFFFETIMVELLYNILSIQKMFVFLQFECTNNQSVIIYAYN